MNLKRITLRITANSMSIICLILLYSIIGMVMVFCGNYASVLVLLFSIAMSVIVFCVVEKSDHQEAVVVIILLITAFQNIFMSLFLEYISSDEISFLIVINYLFACVIFAMLFFTKHSLIKEKYIRKNLIIFFMLVIYSLFLLVMRKTSVVAFFASFRNITCPIMFFIIGLYISDKADLNKLSDIILKLSLVILAIGIVELFVYKDMWLDLNIGELWNRKGIFYNVSTGRPYNHYSAEIIFGASRRRMVSTFAEPVNLGTFFLLCYFFAFLKKKRLYMLTSVIGCIMTISKGTLLGILLLVVIWSFYHLNKKSFVFISAVFLTIFIVLYFEISSAGNSINVHINGFIASIQEMIKNPIGVGLGNAGVYGQLTNEYAKSQIQESGIGVVIAQLGAVGLIIYILFFLHQYKAIHMSRHLIDNRTLIFSYSMIFSYILLIIFSESALGPNASAGFMIVIGILCQRSFRAVSDNLTERQNKNEQSGS